MERQLEKRFNVSGLDILGLTAWVGRLRLIVVGGAAARIKRIEIRPE
jgi:hypothetical protein